MYRLISFILSLLILSAGLLGLNTGSEVKEMTQNYTLEGANISVQYNPLLCDLRVKIGNEIWKWAKAPHVKDKNKICHPFSTAVFFGAEKFENEDESGIYADYGHFGGRLSRLYYLKLRTYVGIKKGSDDLIFRIEALREPDAIFSVYFPAAFKFGAKKGEGYTVLPTCQGSAVPAKYGENLNIGQGMIFSREAYMPLFGQVRNGTGYGAIYETPYDAAYSFTHRKGGDSVLAPIFLQTLGEFSYKRSMIYSFFEEGDFNTIAKRYRSYLEKENRLLTLEDKTRENPAISYLPGTPIFHTITAYNIHPLSRRYNKDNPELNHYLKPFSQTQEDLVRLKQEGFDRVYIHLDGWGQNGYDSHHPDIFPINEAAGGAAGMKALADKANDLGYVFGVHDNYRDYYYNADDFSFDRCITEANGKKPYGELWFGGPQSILCSSFSEFYVRRNYNKFRDLGINIGGAYLDVFSVVELDECYDPRHPTSRKQCSENRNAALDVLTEMGIIPSSEETTDCTLPSIALCHHSPHYAWPWGEEWQNVNHIPLFNLVYHDCIIVPWYMDGDNKGLPDWGSPKNHWAFLHAILNGGTGYVYEYNSPRHLELIKILLELHERVALLEMISVEIVDNDWNHMRSTFADGTVVEVNFKTNDWSINYPD